MRISHNTVISRMKTRRTPARSSRRPLSRGATRNPTTTSAAITWCGRATWCSPPPRCWLADASIRRAARSSTWPARSVPDGGFAQNFWIDGTPYWTGIQLDEVAFPIMLAWRLWKADGLGSFDITSFVTHAAAFLTRYAPVTQQERWEENAGYSPSTLATVISGLICARPTSSARTATASLRRVLRGLRRLDRSASRRVDHHHRRLPAARRQAPLHAHPSARTRRAVS